MNLPASITELIDKSLALERSGDIGAAFQCAQQALSQAQVSGESEAIAAAQSRLAALQFRLSHYDEARALAQEAMVCADLNSPTRADALLLLGICAGETDDLVACEDFLRRAIDLSRQLGYDRVLLRGLHDLSAGVYMPRGQFDLSLAADREALRLANERGMPELAWGPLTTMSWVYWLTGRRAQARATLEDLRHVALPGSLADGYYHCILANLASDEELFDQAPPLYARARSIAESLGSPELNIVVRQGLSRYHRAIGDVSTARAWADDALTIATRIRYRHLHGMALIERGRAAWLCSDTASAEADLRTAIEIMTPLRTDLDLARAFFLLAALLRSQGRAEAKSAWIEAASRIAGGGYAILLDQERALAFPLVALYLNDPETESVSAALLAHLQRVPPAPLRILSLGKFEVWQGARLIEKRALRTRRADELLGLLLVSPGHSLSRDQIVEALWPEQEPAAVQMRFHHATSTLRRALEPDLPDKFPSRYLDIETGQITLRLPPGSSVDSESFEQCVRQKHWAPAITLYRGDLLPNALYADWAVAPRESLIQLYLRALLALAQDQLTTHPQEALESCRRVLAREPWQEQAVLLGMRACLALNDRAGALRLYRKLASALENDLGAQPQEELESLYHSLTKPSPKKSSA